MRYLLATILAIFLATPVYAATTVCRMDGPHNCTEQNEDQLVSITKKTINHMHLTHPQHVFKTENDAVLENYARQQAQAMNNAPERVYPGN